MARAPEQRRGAAARAPTREQQVILADARIRPDEDRKITAFAGTGKTTTLEMLATDRQDPGMYLAFNSPIKEEASRKFPAHIKVSTAHGAAYAAMGMYNQPHRLDRRVFGSDVPRLVDLPDIRIMPQDALGQIVLETVSRFCNSADPEIAADHVALDPREPEILRLAALEGARRLFGRMSDRNDRDCPMIHDAYLKMWQLGEPRLAGRRWLMFDEAQDASPVMVSIATAQGIPITWVGDENQSIYQWRGAVNAMRNIDAPGFALTQSFRFGPDIAGAANSVLRCKPEGLRPALPIIGNPGMASQIGTLPHGARHTFLSRTNAEWFKEALEFRGRVKVIGGLDEAEKLLLSAYHLWRNNERPNKCAATIARFTTWRQLCEHAEQFDDRELLFARNLVEKQYRDRLPDAVRDLRRRYVESEEDADLIVGTAHKCKGREWGYVRLGSGFVSPLEQKWAELPETEREAELNLLYVALSRAIDGLEPNQAVLDCVALARGEVRPGEQPPPRHLPEIRIAPAANAQADRHNAEPPARQVPPLPAALRRPWEPEEDDHILEMLDQGFCVEDIAGWIGRQEAAVAVRIAVIRGAEGDLADDIHAALASPVLRAVAPPPIPAIAGVEPHDGLGPMDFMAHFANLDRDEPEPPALRM